ncbi:MAG: L-glutamate gamma-semialdehyde dehydrogenase [Actinobacteria bacterium]|nr:L-glutamate gamma-semialdehyde dehydrogenase [Actinomycetota bacterium]
MTHERITASTISGTLSTPPVRNEAIKDYRPGSPERSSLEAELKRQQGEIKQAPMVIGGQTVESGNTFEVRSPHNTSLQLAEVHGAGPEHVDRAIRAALDAAHDWAALPWQDRVAVFLRAADLVAGTWRDRINASTILGQSKSIYQSEIDAIVEMADFWRFNAHFVERIYAEQPMSAPGMWNYLDYRPLEGFVLALTPFNFTCIGANLSSAPAMMGNVVVWKPSEKQAFSAQYTMELLLEAGLPPGVINLVHGDGAMVSDVAMRHSEFAGLHFTGSTTVFRSIWRKAGENLDNLRSYPRLVGETGGKDFVLAHPSAGVDALVVGLGRGAFEYQGQKCSAPSRAYIPRSLWPQVSEGLKDLAESIPQGDVADMSNFMGAVIDETAFNRHKEAVEAAVASGSEVLTGAKFDPSEGWFVAPTVLVTENPQSDTMVRELFGPVLTVYVYDDDSWDKTLDVIDDTSPYALTGAVFSNDRSAVHQATNRLRNAAGNFYINDKPTGAVVGQQPFGGSRASGTNDKAGSIYNLLRWTTPRTIKETFSPPTDWRYPHLG